MFGIHHYASFVSAILVFQAIPGPGTLTILRSTARGGVRAGMGAVFGTLTGDLVFMVGAVFGLAAVLAARPVLLGALQWLGIAYLCWLGIKLLWAPAKGEKSAAALDESPPVHFRQALAVCLTNPKAILFFMAFFPLFLEPGSRRWVLAAMIAHVTLLSLAYQSGLVLLGQAVSVKLSRFRYAQLVARRLAGLALIGFGIRLAVNRR